MALHYTKGGETMNEREIKDEFIRLRYTKAGAKEVKEAAKRAGLSTSDFSRMAIHHAVVNGIGVGKGYAPGSQHLSQQQAAMN
jgi:hypothetical protein